MGKNSRGHIDGDVGSSVEDYNSLIEFINTLQKINNLVGRPGSLDLPQIVVVGSQSCGKSSVLEGLVGRTFLPRGTGIVTKCPIILQIVNNVEQLGDGGDEDAAAVPQTFMEFIGEGDLTRYTDFQNVCNKIKLYSETRAKRSSNGVISDEPIIVRICSPDLVTLTVVDLPGVTKVHKDLPDFDIESATRDLVKKFIQNENSLILAVSAMGDDIWNSEALKLARQVDPTGERTLGVLTKIDLMDAGTNAVELLTGTHDAIPYEMIAVINRSQKDIQENKSIEKAIEEEENFLKGNPHYQDLADKNGTKYLRKRLNQCLVKHISKCLPALKVELGRQKADCAKELAILGTDDAINKGDYVMKAIFQFSTNFHAEIYGSQLDPEITRDYGGRKIQAVLLKKFKAALKCFDPTQGLTRQNVKRAILNSGAFHLRHFLPEVAYQAFARRQIAQLLQPSLECASLVYNEMLAIVDNCMGDKKFFQYPSFNVAMRNIMGQLLEGRREKAIEYLEHYNKALSTVVLASNSNFRKTMDKLIDDTDVILKSDNNTDEDGEDEANDTSDEESDGGDASLEELFNRAATDALENGLRTVSESSTTSTTTSSNSSDHLSDCFQVVKKLVRLYYKMICKQVLDYVPALLAESMILYYNQKELNFELMKRLNEPCKYESLVQVPKDTVEKRRKALEWQKKIEEASAILETRAVI